MQIFNQHLGVVESVDGEIFNVRYWELVIPCRLADGFDESIAGKPVEGSDVQFAWNHKVAGALDRDRKMTALKTRVRAALQLDCYAASVPFTAAVAYDCKELYMIEK